MLRECVSKFHKGSPIFGEKPPYGDRSVTSGYCDPCLDLEMEQLEKQGLVGSDWREELKKFRGGNPFLRRRNKMAGPKVGDFVLFEDYTWVIRSIDNQRYAIAECLDESGENDEVIEEEFLLESLEPTDIKTWEAQ